MIKESYHVNEEIDNLTEYCYDHFIKSIDIDSEIDLEWENDSLEFKNEEFA